MIGVRLIVGFVLAVSAGGCASAAAPTLANRFVRQGTPAVDLGGPRPKASRAKKAEPLEKASIVHDVSRYSASMSALESAHPELRDALFRVALAPTPEHHLGVARAYRRVGIFDSAFDYLSRSLDVNGPTPRVLDARARLWRDWGMPDQGVPDWYRAVHLAPEWPAAYNTLGTLFFKMGLRADARAQFEKAVALDPGAAYALQNLCVLSLAEGRTRDAISQCRQAEAIRSKQPRKPSKTPQEPRP